ncbi:DUF3231 family protein [Cytobacillus gottheilii]|uniref:DUF3231 family protein n=1 Tax=Cytobacillus gottheilii TaxID=859144 RepID=UPI003CF1605A
MEKSSHNVELTSSEIANLWTQYMNDSSSICILTHSIEQAKDEEVKDILIFARSLAETHIEKISEFFHHEHFPIPKGFTIEEDVNINAPALFTDTFMLVYMHVMTLLGLTGYAGAVATSSRLDQIKYFTQCNMETMELYERIAKVMLKKGIYSKPPRINTPKQVDYVEHDRYLTGWFGKKRALSVVEISGISFNMVKIIVKVALEIGFGQVAQREDVQKYFQRGKALCEKQFGRLSSVLTKAELASPASWVSEVTSSTTPPYSDKLMLNHIVILVAAAIGYYGAGMSVSQRRDLAYEYTRLMTEVGLYAEDGAELLIKYGWLEQPPLADDRESLANKK